MARPNAKERVRDHYDRASPYYREFWGEHIHHGYWIHGDETKEIAQLQLIEHLAKLAGIPARAKILDVGCGVGGSSIYLARQYQADVIGITISPVQGKMANKAAAEANADAKFLVMDAEAMKFKELFDVVWSVESISHYQDVPRFFASAAELIKPGGILAITDWFQREKLTPAQYNKYLRPIEEGMLVELHTMEDYAETIAGCGLKMMHSEVLNKHCAKTWDFCLDIIKNKMFWGLAARNGKEFVKHLHSFRAMRAGYRSGCFIYGLMVAKKLCGAEQ